MLETVPESLTKWSTFYSMKGFAKVFTSTAVARRDEVTWAGWAF